MKQKNSMIALTGALLCVTNSASAGNIYANNMTALNINALTDTFVNYAHYGKTMADLFAHRSMYGRMEHIDEYGDDGSTTKSRFGTNGHNTSNNIFDNIWLNADHLNRQMHYGKGISERARFNLATFGAQTKSVPLKYGRIAFGGFASYINAKMPDFHSNGDTVGLFANYNFHNIEATALTDFGSLNSSMDKDSFNNSWVNVALDAGARFNIDKTFLVRPGIYASYTFVSSDDLYLSGDKISSKDFNFFNIAPSVQFIKEISPNWYGALSAKYVAHFGGDNDIYINDTKISGLDLDDYTDIGIDAEHNFRQFVFGAKIHKQIGGFDAWSANLNAKYVF